MASKKHRGRVQAQGDGLEESESWSQDKPITKAEGLTLLDRLKSRLTKSDFEKREKAFEKAEHYINNASGIDAVKKKSFYSTRKDKRVRVDIEVLGGRAFVAIILLILALSIWMLL
ncbi:MAG: hypothetical protein NXI25_19590 [bacterium]|nr:hypothetical protein [bacterium]